MRSIFRRLLRWLRTLLRLAPEQELRSQATKDVDPGRRECERRAAIDAANRQQDRVDEALDLRRGPGGRR